MGPSSSQTLDSNSDAGNQPSSTPSDSAPVALPPAASIPAPAETPASNTPNSIPNPAPLAPPPPAVPSFVPSFRPLGAPPVPQSSGASNLMTQNPAFLAPMGQTPSIHPPGVSTSAPAMLPGAPPGAVLPLRPGIPYQVAPGQPPAPMPYAQVGNGYMAAPPQGPMAMPPPGGLSYLCNAHLFIFIFLRWIVVFSYGLALLMLR